MIKLYNSSWIFFALSRYLILLIRPCKVIIQLIFFFLKILNYLFKNTPREIKRQKIRFDSLFKIQIFQEQFNVKT